ncbi:hypothetical protein GOBAR_AA00593 [Gossypium barbadense]|uniref:Large ribosomal subunit protein bL33c n=4 Tax=Gossypium TaxID=3633 RepID=A0A2P5YWI2_GOSBA|nr:hypothetical protein GOBAR_AA00593 [Gossypium barbadense]
MRDMMVWCGGLYVLSLDLFVAHEMGDKKKKTFMFIRLVSAAGTGFFYVKRKSAKKVAEKLEFRKYDPRIDVAVLFLVEDTKLCELE